LYGFLQIKAATFIAIPNTQLSGVYVPVSLIYGNTAGTWPRLTDIKYLKEKIKIKETLQAR